MSQLDINGRLAGALADERDAQLAEILDGYLADLEGGLPPDVEGLLADHPELADELKSCLDSLQIVHDATRPLRSTQPNLPVEPKVPRSKRIGDYHLVREIGRGGMGIVYEAHEQSLNRRVALKILPFAAMLDSRQVARFRNEAQAAAQLHHPHIVPVFAVGQERGVYYYAMQLVAGRSLEEVIRQERTASAAASETDCTAAATHNTTQQSGRSHARRVAQIGVEAAEALGHAHEVGIVHRDIKPSNLLLDGEGKTWVTDFGLARVQADSGVTVSGDVVGTLRYMSPEQATGQNGLVDARTDVYSLGATLYELLTLQPALCGDDRQALLRQLESGQYTPIRQLNPSVPIDLETIVHHAMGHEPHERYATALEFSDDLKRFLAGEPTHARRPTVVDRAARWTRRHRSLVSVAAASVLLISVLSTAGVLLLARERSRTIAALNDARASAAEARDNFERAEEHFQQAREVVDRFGLRTADRLDELPGTEQVRERLLAETLGYYRQFVNRAQGNPQLRHELAEAHFKSGVLAARLGHVERADASYRQAETLLRTLLANAPSNDLQSRLALVHNNLGLLHADAGDHDLSKGEYQQAITIGAQLAAADGTAKFINQLAETRANYGMLLDRLGDTAAAVAALEQAAAALEPLVAEQPANPRHVRNLAICSNNLSHVKRSADLTAAEAHCRRAVQLLEAGAESRAFGETGESDLALCYNNLAAILTRQHQLSEAAECYRQAIGLQAKLARRSPNVVRHRSELAISLNNLGVLGCRQGAPAAADAAFRQARGVLGALADDFPHQLQYRSGLAALLNNQGLALTKAGRLEEAVSTYEAAAAAGEHALALAADPQPLRPLLSKVYFNQARAHTLAGQHAAATEIALARRQLWADNGPRLFTVAVELAGLANVASDHELQHETIDTIAQALAAGFTPHVDLAADERFASVRNHPEFAKLLTATAVSQNELHSAVRTP